MRRAKFIIVITFTLWVALTAWVDRPRADRANAAFKPGNPLLGLSQEQRVLFESGRAAFMHEQTIDEGLGPIFNAPSCATCHGGVGRVTNPVVGGIDPTAQPTVGSYDPISGQTIREPLLGNFIAEHRNFNIGATNADGSFNNLANLGGGLIQKFCIKDLNPYYADYPDAETIPTEATLISMRETPPVFGNGLIDAIPDSEIAAHAIEKPYGIHGVVNWGTDQSGAPRAGRFGWKGQVTTLLGFTAGALSGELGVTNPISQNESKPLGKECPPVENVKSPNDDGTRLYSIFYFQSLLDGPHQHTNNLSVQRGEQIFNSVGCVQCHVTSMRTAAKVFLPTANGNQLGPIAALSNKTVQLYSDLLIHDLGERLADGLYARAANGRQWRTTPLWGLSGRPYLLHDGRANSVEEAIDWHGGEAQIVRDRFFALSDQERAYLIAFLNSL